MNGIVDILIDISNFGGYIYGPFVRFKIIPYRRKSILTPDMNEINVWFSSAIGLNLFKEETILKSGGRIFNLNVNDVSRVGEDDIKDDYKGKEEDKGEIYGVNSPKGVKLKLLCYPGNYDQTKIHFVAILSRKLPFDFLENRILFSCKEETIDPKSCIKKRMRFFDLIKNGKLFYIMPIGIKIIPINVKNIMVQGTFGGRASSFFFNSGHSSSANSESQNETEDNLFKIEDVNIEQIIDNCVNNELIPTDKFVKKVLSYDIGSQESNQLLEEVLKLKGFIIKYKVGEVSGASEASVISGANKVSETNVNEKWCGYLIEANKNIILKTVSLHFFLKCMNENKYVPKFNYLGIKAKKNIS